MSTLRLPKNLKDYLIHEGGHWDTYQYQNYYIKMKKNLDAHFDDNLYILLEALQKEKYQSNQISKVEEIYYKKKEFIGYRCESKEGINLYDTLKSCDNLLEEYFYVAKSLLNLLKIAQKRQIVMKDIITRGNLLYEKNKKRVNVIDVDSFQIPEYTDTFLHEDAVDFISREMALNSKKYIIRGEARLTNEFNILSFYEIMFRGIFQTTILDIHPDSPYTSPYLKERVLYQRRIEENLCNKLNFLGFDSKTDLYERILDLINPNVSNSISIYDFEHLATHYKYDKKRAKLLS